MQVYLGISKAYTGVWLPLTSRIYETLLTGSELYWGNLTAHKFGLKALVAPRGKKILAIIFLCSEYFAHVVRYNYLTPLLLELSMWISNLLFEI